MRRCGWLQQVVPGVGVRRSWMPVGVLKMVPRSVPCRTMWQVSQQMWLKERRPALALRGLACSVRCARSLAHCSLHF
jgi:hypothetical protein